MKFRGVAIAALAAATSIGQACCITFADFAMRLAAETAIIVWDEEKKIEHFIRRAEFIGKAKDFGFIFPSPTQPFRITVANEDTFAKLETHRPTGIGCALKAEPAADAVAGSVEVLEEKMVGDFKATVFRAQDGAAITKWLADQGHRMRPAMTPWFDHYAQKSWVFTALKYTGRQGRTPTKALCISFNAPEPFYPFKMPSDTFSPDTDRRIDLYVLSQRPMDGRLTDGSAWAGRRDWSVGLPGDTHLRLARSLLADGSAIELPARLALTRFRNTPAANVYEQDIVFSPTRNATPFWIAAFVAAIAPVVWRRLRRSTRQHA